MCECLDYDDGSRHTCEACVGDLEFIRAQRDRYEEGVSEIQYDPACKDCRSDAGRPNAKTTWQCHGHIVRERDRYEEALREIGMDSVGRCLWCDYLAGHAACCPASIARAALAEVK